MTTFLMDGCLDIFFHIVLPLLYILWVPVGLSFSVCSGRHQRWQMKGGIGWEEVMLTSILAPSVQKLSV